MVNFSAICEKIRIKQFLILLAGSLLLSACGDSSPNPVCVENDDLGNNLTRNQTMVATNNGWVDSGITVESGKKLTISSSGSVYLCQGNPVVEETQTFTPLSTIWNWQDSGVIIKKGYKYTFEVTGAYTIWTPDNTGCLATDKYLDTSCYFRQGKGLFAYIGNTPLSGTSVGTEIQDDGDNFLEMYRRDTQPGGSLDANGNPVMVPKPSEVLSGYSGYGIKSIPSEGKLWFRYRDNITSNVQDSFTADWYSDNRGAYTVTVKRYSPCFGTDGKYVKASIGSTGGSGTVINVGQCSAASSSSNSDPSADVCSNGAYSTLSAPASGKVWLKIDDSVANGADGDYSQYNAAVYSTVTTGPYATDANGNTLYDNGNPVYLKYNADGTPDTTYRTTKEVITSAATGSNTGSYLISVTTAKPEDTTFSKAVNNIIDPIRTLLLGSNGDGGLTKKMYNNLTANGQYIQAIRALMALSIVFFAFKFMLGLESITHREFFNLMLKMAFIIALIGPNSWNFFSTYLFSFFIKGTDNLIWIMSNNINSLIVGTTPSMVVDSVGSAGADQGRSVFGFLNNTLTILFSKETHIKLQALFVSFPIGPVIAGVMYIGIFFFLFALIKAIFTYLVAIIMTALLIFMAPIFIPFMLFDKTKTIYEKWLKQLVGFSLQPILIFMVLAVFNVFIVLSLYSVLNFSACYSCIFNMDMPLSEIINSNQDFDTFCMLYGYLPWGVDASQDTATKISKTPVGLFYALIFVILANAMLNFLSWIDTLAISLTGSNAMQIKASGAFDNAKNEVTAASKTTAGMAYGSAKFASSYAAKAVNAATLGLAGKAVTAGSDSVKKTIRSVLPKTLVSGGKDRTGEHLAVSESLMTSAERKGYQRKMREFDKLTTAGKQAVKDMNRDRRDMEKIEKGGNKGITGRMADVSRSTATFGGKAANAVTFGLAGKVGNNVRNSVRRATGGRFSGDIFAGSKERYNSYNDKYSLNKNAKLRELEELGSMKKKDAKEVLKGEGGIYNRKTLKDFEKARDTSGIGAEYTRGRNEEMADILKNASKNTEEIREQYKKDVVQERKARAEATGLDVLRSGQSILAGKKKEERWEAGSGGKEATLWEKIRTGTVISGDTDKILDRRNKIAKREEKKQAKSDTARQAYQEKVDIANNFLKDNKIELSAEDIKKAGGNKDKAAINKAGQYRVVSKGTEQFTVNNKGEVINRRRIDKPEQK